MDDFESFSEFLAGLGKRAAARLPDSILPVGKDYATGAMVPFLLDEDYRLVMEAATPRYYGRNPQEVSTAITALESGDPTQTLMVVNIHVTNVTASPVALTLWHDEENPPRSSHIFGMCGGTVPANSYWQWQGALPLEVGYYIWGQAGAANALYAHLSLRQPLHSHRLP